MSKFRLLPLTLLSMLGSCGPVACSSGRVGADGSEPSTAPPPASASAGADEGPAPATPAAAVQVVIDPSQTHQTWEGAGSSLMAWDDKARAQYRSDAWQQLWADDMGMTILRIDLLPTPLDERGLHHLDPIPFGPDLDANVALFDYRRSERAAIFGEVARDLVLRGVPLQVIASVWTPPHWMKDGATIAHNGNDSGGGTLRMDAASLQQYARYMAAAVTAWERTYGVPIRALSIQNEPRFRQGYNSMELTPAQYPEALAAVAAELDRHGMKTLLFGPEDVGYGPAGDHSRIDQQLRYLEAIKDHPRALAALDAIAVHGYGGDGIDSGGFVAPDNWRYYWSAIESSGLPSWQTETGGGPPEGLGPVFFANVLYEGMTYGHISMWCNWLFSAGGPLDQHALVGADLDTNVLKYAVAKHYFRFIRPGAQRLGVEPADDHGLRTVAWRNPDGGLAVVIVNMREQEVELQLDLGAAPAKPLVRYQTTGTANFVTLGPVAPAGTTVSLRLPATSLTTLGDAL